MFLFPMAGLSSRFTAAGFTQPKYMLPAGDRSLFEHSISGFSAYYESTPFLFIYLAEIVDPSFILEGCERRGLPADNVRLAGLPAPTEGQAATVSQGLAIANVDRKEPITIFNIDTMYRTFQQPDFAFDPSVDGYLDVFQAEGDHWSFVRPFDEAQEQGFACEVTEKRRISQLCSTGLYHFREAGLFMDAFEEIKGVALDHLPGNERYIAPLYNQLIEKGRKIGYRQIAGEDIRFSGTPAEYRDFVEALPFNYG
ncbi:capsular biosynthesis protein [Sphingobium sp. RSMS]|uniref:capsular biosynthesis protein n=1 Tax=Sphingobium sp. RSMS TaxID=520734 RepID=UPI0014850AF0|nr:capsular biosynthesis protein [Sphingobium sp. RSMS]UXC89786.1 capsular biosynthesis protein [Sphingobium sp. RSMS]